MKLNELWFDLCEFFTTEKSDNLMLISVYICILYIIAQMVRCIVS